MASFPLLNFHCPIFLYVQTLRTMFRLGLGVRPISDHIGFYVCCFAWLICVQIKKKLHDCVGLVPNFVYFSTILEPKILSSKGCLLRCLGVSHCRHFCCHALLERPWWSKLHHIACTHSTGLKMCFSEWGSALEMFRSLVEATHVIFIAQILRPREWFLFPFSKHSSCRY